MKTLPIPHLKLPIGLLLLFLASIASIAFILVPKIIPQAKHPESYPYPLNLPGTTDRRQSIQTEIALYQTKVKQDPQSGLNLSALADAYWKMGKATGEVSWYLLAEKMATRSLSVLPFENTSAQITLAQIAQARHDFSTAKTIANSVLKAKANRDEAWSILITVALATGNLSEAESQVKSLVQRMPNLGTLTLKALVEEAQGKPIAAETFRRAIQTEEAGEIGGSALVRVLLGRHLYHQGKLDQAATLYQEALRILPRYPLALMHLAALETRRGNYQAADRYYDQVIAYSQQSTNIYDHTILRGKARLRQLQGQSQGDLLQKAETLLRQETNAGHANGGFGHRRELAQLLLDRQQPADAIEALKLMQDEINVRQDAQTWGILARALMQNDRFLDARQAMRSAIKLGTQHAGLYRQAAQIEEHLGDTHQAKIYSEKAQQIDPTFDESAQLALGLDTL
jgi:tetratricopeptide (TPR) repeat protein